MRRVISAMDIVAPNFFFDVQFSGFSGSSGPSQSTMLGSRGISGSLVSASLEPCSRSTSSDFVFMFRLLAVGVGSSKEDSIHKKRVSYCLVLGIVC